jgi:hypothetical protein
MAIMVLLDASGAFAALVQSDAHHLSLRYPMVQTPQSPATY